MSKEILKILTNREVIAINQDPLGIQGTLSVSLTLNTPLLVVAPFFPIHSLLEMFFWITLIISSKSVDRW
jgi:hypothetical protein